MPSSSVAFAIRRIYGRDMADARLTDPFVSTEEEVEVDAAIAAAIELGIQQADEGRTVPLEDVRKMIPEWISKFESRQRR